jgi:GAF domain-containing protein/HAMP domain-containing protein
MRRSLRTRLTIVFIGLAIIPLLLIGGGVSWLSFRDTRAQALDLEHQIAQNISTKIAAFIGERESELRLLVDIVELQRLDRARQSSLLSGLLSAQNIYDEVALLDSQGQEEIRLSRLTIISVDELGNRAGMDEFEKPRANGETYYSAVQFDEETGEPSMIIAAPLFDLRSGEFAGVLMAKFRFKAVWDLMASAKAGGDGVIYVVSKSDSKVIAHHNPSVVLQETQFDPPAEDGFYPGLDGTDVAMAVESIKLGEQEFAVVAEKPVAEALTLAINAVYITVIVMAISLVIAGVLGFLAARQIVRPIGSLATTAQAISAGDLSQQVEVNSRDEVGELAGAFNNMTIQLRSLFDTLEDRIQERTQRLEIAATLSERLSAILDFDQLLVEMVDQVKESFDYYHAHVYIIDDDRQNLVMTAGTGEAGMAMKASFHSIPMHASTSLVARAARTGEIVRVDNVRETEGWLSNPLLPDTRSEMAVPIILKEQVVGVLDVQENKLAGLDEGDAALLRSLANQVAIAIRNARLFAEVEAALAEVRTAQERYARQSWEKVRVTLGGDQYLYVDPNTPPPGESEQIAMAEVGQKALAQNHSVVVSNEYLGGESLVAPINLRNTTIGTLQLHADGGSLIWDEDDLALVEAVVDQLAQTAENLRLFEETRQHAGREQTIRQITDKLRAAPNLEELITIATQELGERLEASYTKLELGVETE